MNEESAKVVSTSKKRKCKKIPPEILLPLYGFFTGFRPSDPYQTPYLIYSRGFSPSDVVDIIYPASIYATPFFLAIFAIIFPYIPSFKILLYIGYISQIVTYSIWMYAADLKWMITNQVFFAVTCSAEVVYFGAVYFFVEKKVYQKASAMSRISILIAHIIASIIGQLLVSFIDNFDKMYLFTITLGSEIINIVFLVMMPNGGADLIYKNPTTLMTKEEEQKTVLSESYIELATSKVTNEGNEKGSLNTETIVMKDNEKMNQINQNNNLENNFYINKKKKSNCSKSKIARLLFMFDAFRSDHLGISASLMSVISNTTYCLFVDFAFNLIDEIDENNGVSNGWSNIIIRVCGVIGSLLAPVVLRSNTCFSDEKDLNIQLKSVEENLEKKTNEEDKKEEEREINQNDINSEKKKLKKKKKAKGTFASFTVSFIVIPCVFLLMGLSSFIFAVAQNTYFAVCLYALNYCFCEFALTMSWACIAMRTSSKAYPSVFTFTLFLAYILQCLIQGTVFSSVSPSIFGLSVVRSHYIYIGFMNCIGLIIVGGMGIDHACKIKKATKANINKQENKPLLEESIKLEDEESINVDIFKGNETEKSEDEMIFI